MRTIKKHAPTVRKDAFGGPSSIQHEIYAGYTANSMDARSLYGFCYGGLGVASDMLFTV